MNNSVDRASTSVTDKPQFNGEWVKLGTCFPYIKNGMNVKQQKDNSGIPITRIETLSGNRFNRDKVGYAGIFSTEGIEDRLLSDGDILMSHINSLPYLGRAVMYERQGDEQMIHGMNLLRLKVDRSLVRPDYAAAYFRSEHFRRQIIRIANKSVNQASFSVRNLKELSFPLVSLDMQEDIVERLSVVDGGINALQQMSLSFDSLVKSRFNEVFGDMRTNSKKLPIAVWRDVLVIKNGRNQKAVECTDGPYPICGSGGVMSRASSYITSADSVIIGRKGNINTPILMREPFWNVDTAFGVEPNEANLTVEYLYWFCRWFDFNRLNKAVTIPSLTKTDLYSIQMPLPDMSSQKRFSAFVSQVDKLRFDVQQQIDKLELLKSSLMQEYFG